jgi:hypothetical protein
MSSQQLYAQRMTKKKFPDTTFVHPTHYSTIMNCDWLTSKSPVLPLPPKIQKVGTLFRHVSRFCAVERF